MPKRQSQMRDLHSHRALTDWMRMRLVLLIGLCFFFIVVPYTRTSATNTTTCPSYDVFQHQILRRCPAMSDTRCVLRLPGDQQVSAMLNCAASDPQMDPKLRVVNATQLTALLRHRDPYGRPWCMLTFFYSPKCFFSAKIARSLHEAATLFPRLIVVAVDATTLSASDSDGYFGITSTPTLTLWENGYPRYRLLDDFSHTDTLVTAVETRTDLAVDRTNHLKLHDHEQQENSENEEKRAVHPNEFLGQFSHLRSEGEGLDLYFMLALATLAVNALYFVLFSPHSVPVAIRQRTGELIARLVN